MKHSTLLLSLLLTASGAVKAQFTTTPITAPTDVNEATNKYVYHITTIDAARGALYTPYNADGTPKGNLATCGSTYTGNGYSNYASVTKDPSDAKQQFALITYKERLYLYSVAAGQFVYHTPNHAILSTSADLIEFVTVNNSAQAGYYDLKFLDTDRLNFSNSPSGLDGIYTRYSANDPGNQLTFGKVFESGEQVLLSDEQYESALKILRKVALQERVTVAEGLLNGHAADAAGYPNAAARATLQSAIDAASVLISGEDVAEAEITTLENAINAYYATTEVNLPADGKAYKIKAKYLNTNTFTSGYAYMQYHTVGSDLRLSVYADEADDLSDVFVCKRLADGKVALVNPLTGYLIFYADGKTGIAGNNTGHTAAYDNQATAITLEHNCTPNLWTGQTPADKEQFFFGSFCIKARNNNGAMFYFMAGDNNGHDYHDAGAGTYGCITNRSSYFYFEETDYPAGYKPALNAAQGIEDGKYIGTFSAPYTTVVPEGLAAYTVNGQASEDGETVATTTLLAEAGEAIPAGTGVILYGDITSATMEPATGETIATAEGTNLLEGTSAGTATKPADGESYLLGMKNGVVAFYNWTSGDLRANKAYLHLAQPAAANGIRLRFGESTGIGAIVETDSAQAPLYDLSGRRVSTPAKGGIYIREGRKIIIK